jgi:hypothetical protein
LPLQSVSSLVELIQGRLVSNGYLIQEVAKIALSGESSIFEIEIRVNIGFTPGAPKRSFLSIVNVRDLSLVLTVLVLILCCLG